ncbi:MAG TPA: LPS export ABC transporter periplasmic protein LptC [Steroidobacteraceae bacterium]|nr:LPS export ABC transporter periplasmic protein LptC [Steroidobacteraceae bacterium]
MRIGAFVVLLVLLAIGAAALWYWRSGQPAQQASGGQTAQTPEVAYAYEAHDVVLRQMGPDGRQVFQVEAREITQLPDSGRVTAQGVTVYHDPPGTAVGGPNRWTLTADRGELPAEGGVITLAGRVRAHGIPVGGKEEVTLATEHLRYDPALQELSTDDEVALTMGGSSMQGRVMRANMRTSEVTLQSDVHGTFDSR